MIFRSNIKHQKRLPPKKKRVREWCEKEDKFIAWLGWRRANKKMPFKKRQRCPKCNKLLTIFLRDCDDFGCVHLVMPKHKEK